MGFYDAPNVNVISGTQHDIARNTWGGTWRLPTKAEQTELVTRCVWIRATVNGVSGMRVEGPNGSSIFLPATGCGMPVDGSAGSIEITATSGGYYWAGESYQNYGQQAYVYYFSNTSYYHSGSWNADFVKMAIRPVK